MLKREISGINEHALQRNAKYVPVGSKYLPKEKEKVPLERETTGMASTKQQVMATLTVADRKVALRNAREEFVDLNKVCKRPGREEDGEIVDEKTVEKDDDSNGNLSKTNHDCEKFTTGSNISLVDDGSEAPLSICTYCERIRLSEENMLFRRAALGEKVIRSLNEVLAKEEAERVASEEKMKEKMRGGNAAAQTLKCVEITDLKRSMGLESRIDESDRGKKMGDNEDVVVPPETVLESKGEEELLESALDFDDLEGRNKIAMLQFNVKIKKEEPNPQDDMEALEKRNTNALSKRMIKMKRQKAIQVRSSKDKEVEVVVYDNDSAAALMNKHKEYIKSLSANIMYIYPNGDVYEGDYRNDGNGGPNIREGLGIFQYKNGDVYVGEFKNNKIDGYGIYRWKNNSVYDGMFKEDQRHGKGVIRYTDGGYYDGEFKKGARHGEGRARYASLARYEGCWRYDKRDGVGIYHYANGNVYRGMFKNGKCHGRGRLEVLHEGVFEGNFVNGEKGEKGVWWHRKYKCPSCYGTISWPDCCGHVYINSKKLGTLSELERNGYGGPVEKQSRKDYFLQLAICKSFEEKVATAKAKK